MLLTDKIEHAFRDAVTAVTVHVWRRAAVLFVQHLCLLRLACFPQPMWKRRTDGVMSSPSGSELLDCLKSPCPVSQVALMKPGDLDLRESSSGLRSPLLPFVRLSQRANVKQWISPVSHHISHLCRAAGLCGPLGSDRAALWKPSDGPVQPPCLCVDDSISWERNRL